MKSVLVILRRCYLDITGNHCAAKLIEYFKHWREWKLKNHRTKWVYMPVRQIYDDLMGEHSVGIIRRAIAFTPALAPATRAAATHGQAVASGRCGVCSGRERGCAVEFIIGVKAMKFSIKRVSRGLIDHPYIL